MKTRLTSADDNGPDDFPHADALAALRAWYAGLSTREAVARYLPGRTSGRAGQPTCRHVQPRTSRRSSARCSAG